jgi:hypothetical protein
MKWGGPKKMGTRFQENGAFMNYECKKNIGAILNG